MLIVLRNSIATEWKMSQYWCFLKIKTQEQFGNGTMHLQCVMCNQILKYWKLWVLFNNLRGTTGNICCFRWLVQRCSSKWESLKNIFQTIWNKLFFQCYFFKNIYRIFSSLSTNLWLLWKFILFVRIKNDQLTILICFSTKDTLFVL